MGGWVGRPVLVGIDGSATAVSAARWAAREAVRRRAPLRLVTAFGWTATAPVPGGTGLGRGYNKTLLQESRDALAEAAAESAAEAEADGSGGDGPPVGQEVLTGHPVQILVAESRRAQLVVVGNRGLGGVARLLVGSVAIGVAADASSPVVVVRGAAQTAIGGDHAPVVVGVDGSPASESAVAFAFEAAASRGVPLVAVHAWHDSWVEPDLAPLFDWEAIAEQERELLAQRLAGWGEKYPDVRVERVVVRDRPDRVLIAQAMGAQLLVVGSHGRGELTGFVLGSVGHTLLNQAPCPVAVVRPDADGAAR